MDDDEFEDLEDSIISGEPSPYDEPNTGKISRAKTVVRPGRIRGSSFVRFGYWCARYRYLDTNPQTLVRLWLTRTRAARDRRDWVFGRSTSRH